MMELQYYHGKELGISDPNQNSITAENCVYYTKCNVCNLQDKKKCSMCRGGGTGLGGPLAPLVPTGITGTPWENWVMQLSLMTQGGKQMGIVPPSHRCWVFNNIQI